MSQGKTIYSQPGETVLVVNQLAAISESRNTSVESVAWSVCGRLTLGEEDLTDTAASASVAVNGCGTVTCTVTLGNGELLKLWRRVEARSAT